MSTPFGIGIMLIVALMLDLRTDFLLPCKLIAYDQLLSPIYLTRIIHQDKQSG